jgi:hypothetical protein
VKCIHCDEPANGKDGLCDICRKVNKLAKLECMLTDVGLSEEIVRTMLYKLLRNR